MKNYLFAVFLIVSTSLIAQLSNAERHYGLSFPIGSKLTIKLTPTDSVYFNLEVIEYMSYNAVVESFENDTVLSKTGDENTISVCFCYATHGKDEKEKKANMHTLLLVKNYTKYRIDYISAIQKVKDGKYTTTSNLGLFPGIKVLEMWDFLINAINLNNFKPHKE